MPKITTGAFTNRNYSPGSYTFPATIIPLGVAAATLSLNRADWTNPASKVDFKFEISLDNGVTWRFGGSFTAEGGVLLGKDGLGATESSATFDFPEPTNALRKVRGTLQVIGVAFRTDGTLTLE